MKKLVTLVILSLTLLACDKKDQYKPETCFTPAQQTRIIEQSVRYSSKIPPGALESTKFDSTFDDYYARAAAEYDLRACAPDKDSIYFFLMTRKARSIWPAREAIGGKLKIDNSSKLVLYEETFRTWKMTEDSLNTRAFELFDLMVNGKDLTPYQSKYKGDRYIELPDDRFYFDKNDKRWHDRELDSLRVNL